MSKWLTRLIVGLIVVTVLLASISGLREKILNDDITNKVFLSILESFPFSKFIAEIVCGLLNYSLPWNNIQPHGIVKDLTLLSALTVVCPLIIGGASAIFLRLPEGMSIDESESYMRTLGYRVKEIVLNVLLHPVCVLITASIIKWLTDALEARFHMVFAFVIEILALVIVIVLSSLFSSIKFSFDFKYALRHHVVDGFLGELGKVLVMNALCIAAALALLNGHLEAAVSFLALMFILLAGIDLMINAIN